MLALKYTQAKFLVSGGSATAIHFAGMALLIGLGSDATIATAIGALLGALVNYILQYKWTFRSTRHHSETIPTFLAVSVSNWLLNVGLFYALNRLLFFSAPWAQTATTTLLAALNYLLYRKVVFI